MSFCCMLFIVFYNKCVFYSCCLQEVEGEEGSADLVVDVDDDLQTELCRLWDMSMNTVSWPHVNGSSSNFRSKQICDIDWKFFFLHVIKFDINLKQLVKDKKSER